MMTADIHITLGQAGSTQLQMDMAHAMEVESNYDNLGSRAVVKLPKRLFVPDEAEAGLYTRIDKWIKRGTPIQIKLGYDGNATLRYEGYVEEVKTGTPIELHCMDELYTLKARSVQPKVFTNATLSQVLQYCGIDQYNLLGEVSGFDFHITPEEVNVAKALMKLKDKLYLPFFFRGKTLIVGKPYDLQHTRNHLLAFGYNIAGHNLEFKRAEDVKLLVKVTIHKKGGQKEEFVAQGSDTDGEQRTLNFYNLSRKDAEDAAARELKRLKFTGLRGTLTCFGEPHIEVGDTVELIDCEEEEKEGKYWVDAVRTTMSKTEGIRQEITLGPRIDVNNV